MMLSVTDLSTYEYCPRQLYLRKVLNIYPPPNQAMVLGTVRHETFENMGNSTEAIVSNLEKGMKYKDVLQKFKENSSQMLQNAIIKNKSELKRFDLDLSEVFRTAWDSVFLETKDVAFKISKFMKESGFYGKELWENLVPKIESELKLSSDKLMLRGIIDKLEIYPEKVVPIELKTGKTPRTGVWPGHQLQIGAYVMLLKEKNYNVDSGFIRYLDSDEIRTVPFNPFLEKKIINLRDEIIEMLEGKEIPPRTEHKCNVCNGEEECYSDDYIEEKLKELNLDS